MSGDTWVEGERCTVGAVVDGYHDDILRDGEGAAIIVLEIAGAKLQVALKQSV